MAESDPLATQADVEARIRRDITDADEIASIEALLSDASSMVRMITGQPFGTQTVTARMKLRNGRVFLAARDVTSITSVETVDGTTLGYTWDGLHWLSVGIPNQFDTELADSDVVDVVYVRTGAAAPQWVKAIVAQMAARAFGRPADQSGTLQESIAGYSYSVGAAAAAGGIGLLTLEEKALREAFPRPLGTAWLGVPVR